MKLNDLALPQHQRVRGTDTSAGVANAVELRRVAFHDRGNNIVDLGAGSLGAAGGRIEVSRACRNEGER